MELKAIDYSRVVHLTNMTRDAGQLFLPKVVLAILNRYEFQTAPSGAAVLEDKLQFRHGVYSDIAIGDMTIYPDGIVVQSSTDTYLLEGFLDDLFQWVNAEFGLKETGIPPRERHFESALVFASDYDLNKALNKYTKIMRSLNQYQEQYGLKKFHFDAFGIAFAPDQTKYTGHRPASFTVARRVGVPHGAGIFYSVAPLKTSDHLSILETLEGI